MGHYDGYTLCIVCRFVIPRGDAHWIMGQDAKFAAHVRCWPKLADPRLEAATHGR